MVPSRYFCRVLTEWLIDYENTFWYSVFLLIASCSSDPTVMSDDFVAGQCYDLTGDPTTVGMHYLEFADGGAPFTEGFYYGGAEKHIKSMPIFRGKFRLIAGKP